MLGAYKKHPQARQRMYILYILWLRVRIANSILRGTTDIPVRSDTLMIFRSGTDAAGLNRSDVSVSAETRHQKCTRMYTFDDATTQIPAYLQKVYTLQKAAISNIIVP